MNKRCITYMLAFGVCLLAPSAVGEAPPDSDGDGFSDLEDVCPETPGRSASPFGRGCPMAQDASGNWCGLDEHSVNGVCVPVEDTTVTEPPPPDPDATDDFCSNPGNWNHPTCSGSESPPAGGGSGGGGSSGGGGGGGSDDEEEEEEAACAWGESKDASGVCVAKPARDVMEKIKNCLPAGSIPALYWDRVSGISWNNNLVNDEGIPIPGKLYVHESGSPMSIEFNRSVIVEQSSAQSWTFGYGANVALTHEYMHVRDVVEHGPRLWAEPSLEEEMDQYNYGPPPYTEAKYEQYTADRTTQQILDKGMEPAAACLAEWD